MSQLTVPDYSFSLYYKQSWRNPSTLDLWTARFKWVGIAGISVLSSNYGRTDLVGDRTLAVFSWPLKENVGYAFATYNNENQLTNDVQSQFVDLDEYEIGWNWFYFGYSSQRRKAYAYIKIGSGNLNFYEVEFPGREHLSSPPGLKFTVGGAEGCVNPNGKFFDVRVDYGPGAYIGNPDELEAYKN